MASTMLAIPACATEMERWRWQLAYPQLQRMVAMGSALALGAFPHHARGLGLSWWSHKHRAELSLLQWEGGVLHELKHLPTPTTQLPWAELLKQLGVFPNQLSWFLACPQEASEAPLALGKLLPHVSFHTLSFTVMREGLHRLHQGQVSLVGKLGCHASLHHPKLLPVSLSADHSRPARLQATWTRAPLSLELASLCSQVPTQASMESQDWWWCSLSADKDRPFAPAFVFSSAALAAQPAPMPRSPGDGVWLRCDGSPIAHQMKQKLGAAGALGPDAQKRLAHLGAHALWPVAEDGPNAWPKVHAAWTELLAMP